jgi:hypothetical protein
MIAILLVRANANAQILVMRVSERGKFLYMQHPR